VPSAIAATAFVDSFWTLAISVVISFVEEAVRAESSRIS
jgi:hypothetical protein